MGKHRIIGLIILLAVFSCIFAMAVLQNGVVATLAGIGILLGCAAGVAVLGYAVVGVMGGLD